MLFVCKLNPVTEVSASSSLIIEFYRDISMAIALNTASYFKIKCKVKVCFFTFYCRMGTCILYFHVLELWYRKLTNIFTFFLFPFLNVLDMSLIITKPWQGWHYPWLQDWRQFMLCFHWWAQLLFIPNPLPSPQVDMNKKV